MTSLLRGDPKAPSPGRLFVFGLGYSARCLAHRLLALGWQVAGTCRDPDKQAELRKEGIEAHLFDRAHPIADIAARLAGASHLLVSVPPDEAGDPVLDLHGPALASLVEKIGWVGYLSTTGVYGDRQGGWVDEDSPLMPSNARGRRRLAAETSWRQPPFNAHIFRLAGIYGPGRSALDAVRQGKAKRIDKPGQVFSRIHVADIAAIIMASMAGPNPGRVYNVCDGDPAPPGDVVAFACDLLGVEPPPLQSLTEVDLSPMALSFYNDSKRVSNRRIKAELGIDLIYPSYRVGLPALLAAGA